MERKDSDFLVRADRVTANYRQRIAKLVDALSRDPTPDGWRVFIDWLDKIGRLDKLIDEQALHAQRIMELREQQRQKTELNRLCADANKLAGTDGANFWTKAGNAVKEKADETTRL